MLGTFGGDLFQRGGDRRRLDGGRCRRMLAVLAGQLELPFEFVDCGRLLR